MMQHVCKLAFFFSLAILTSCSPYDTSKIDNLQEGKVYKIGHGGSGFKRWFPFQPLPANSLASIKKALNQEGVDGIEVDLQMTQDGKFVLYHDNKLESMTKLQGCISEQDFDQVNQSPYQLEWPFQWFQAEKVLSLEDLMDYLLSLDEFPFLHLDMRTYSNCNQLAANVKYEQSFVPKLHKVLQQYQIPAHKVMLISVTKESAYIAKGLQTPYQLSLEVISDFEADLAWAIENDVQYLTVKPRLLSVEKVKKAHQAGIQIITFGAKSRSGNRNLLDFNPDYIQTDNLPALNDLLSN